MSYVLMPRPCCRCKNRAFRSRTGGTRPGYVQVMRGDRFGFPGGILCSTCYQKLRRRFRKTPPCDFCGNEGVFYRESDVKPRRYKVTHLGLSGKACHDCYHRLRAEVPRPCAKCGDPGGYRPPNQLAPARYDGGPLEINGLLCLSCYQSISRSFNRSVQRALAEVRAEREAKGIPRAFHHPRAR